MYQVLVKNYFRGPKFGVPLNKKDSVIEADAQ